MKFLVSIHHPDLNGSVPDPDGSVMRAIDDLNDEMRAAGARDYANGLYPIETARSIRTVDGKTMVTEGPYLESQEHVGGFWILECPSMEEAIEWGKKATVACRAGVEVRQLH